MSLSRRGSSSATRTVCFLVVMGAFRTSRCSSNGDVSRFCQERQSELECAALGFSFALGPDPPAVGFDEAFANGQSETRPTDHARPLAVHAVTPVEDFVEF